MTPEIGGNSFVPAAEVLADFASRLKTVREQVAQAARSSGRNPEAVTIIGVTKTQSAERAALAVQAGLAHLGENYIQEAQAKMPAVQDIARGAPLTWHFIGHLQSNKARFAVDFAVVQTIDSLSLAQAVDKQAAKRGKIQSVLIEVNTARSGERAGVLAEDMTRLVDGIGDLPNLRLSGLMTIAPLADNAEQVRPVFEQMRVLWESLPPDNRQMLSMGMSGDFEHAIAEGATHVRLGTILFGARPPRAM